LRRHCAEQFGCRSVCLRYGPENRLRRLIFHVLLALIQPLTGTKK